MRPTISHVAEFSTRDIYLAAVLKQAGGLWGLALKSKRFPDYRIRDKRTGRAFRSQIAEAKGNFLTEEGTVVTRFFYKGPSRRLQFDYVGPARVFLRLVLAFSLVIILWKVLS